MALHGACVLCASLHVGVAIADRGLRYPQVLLSTANEYHAGLRQLQFERVRREECFMQRVLSVCFNVSDGLGTCVPGPKVRPAEFRTSNYANLIWAKWRILADALTAVGPHVIVPPRIHMYD